MGARVAGFDWSATSLGPVGGWPVELVGAVGLCLASGFPMSVRWGRELVVLYNDACREVYGEERFSDALGRPTADVWPEVSGLTEQLSAVLGGAGPVLAVDELVRIHRRVEFEECYFTFGYTPIVGGTGVPGGVLSTFMETTAEVVAVRRLGTLAELGRGLNASRSASEAIAAAVDALSGSPMDHPGGALFGVAADGSVSLLAAFGVAVGAGEVDGLVAACVREGALQHGQTVGDDVVVAWHAFPVRDPEEDACSHVLVVGQHRQRPWDEGLATYLELLTASVGAAVWGHRELLAERRRTHRLVSLDAAKSAFFAGVSHELRTPLALIAAPVEDVLAREPGLSEESLDSLALVQANVARLSRMVEAMLDFSRMEAGRLVPHLEPLDVGVLARGIGASFAPAFERAGLGFVSDVPEVPRPAVVDRDVFERIVSNLLSNALKYTPSGSVTLAVRIDGDAYEVSVTDTGLGIDLADQEKVFARFERLPVQSGARSSSGAGIGLAMVRQLTALLGGTVGLVSSPGEGSVFTVRLPFVPARAVGMVGSSITPRRVESFLAEIDSWTDPRATLRPGGASKGPRLLVVEDDPELARFLATTLGGDYSVEVVGDGVQALEALRDHHVDIVLTDLTMPVLDGLGLIGQIRADPGLRDLPVVLLSSSGADKDAVTGLTAGADDYVIKPFTLVDLRGRLAANLIRARERSADAAWRRALVFSFHDPLVIFDLSGLVIEINEAFTDLFGFTIADGPMRPPYPWWPTEGEDPEALATIREFHEAAMASRTVDAEVLHRTKDRRPVWIHVVGSTIDQADSGASGRIRVMRDITREKEAQQRRAAAAQISADFGRTDDLATLVGVASHGFAVLFDGGSTIQIDLGQRYLFDDRGSVDAHDLTEQIAAGLAGEPSPDTTSRRPGLLLVPQTTATPARAWVQFPRPRRISVDEMIAADLLAQAFGLAVDRLVTAQQAAEREANLQVALESHRLIGQAVGILVERHRLRPAAAFDKLKEASQHRNLKLRDIAIRVIETGAEPDRA